MKAFEIEVALLLNLFDKMILPGLFLFPLSFFLFFSRNILFPLYIFIYMYTLVLSIYYTL